MTRYERIRDFLVEEGQPRTSREIAAAMGWRINSTSAVVCHARAYGYIEPCGHVPLPPGNPGRCPEYLYRPRPALIRKPGQ